MAAFPNYLAERNINYSYDYDNYQLTVRTNNEIERLGNEIVAFKLKLKTKEVENQLLRDRIKKLESMSFILEIDD